MDPTVLGNNLSTTTTANKLAGTDLLNNQQNKLDAFNTSLSGYYNDPRNSLTAIAGHISDSLGLPTLQANANNINTQVQNLPFTYKDATLGHDVNANQLSRIVGQKTYELTPAMNSANNALAAGNEQFGRLTSQAQQDIANRGIPYTMQQASMLDQMARQSSMFTTGNQQELDGLVAKLNSGTTLTQAEIQRASALAVAEKNYQAAIETAKQNTKYLPIQGLGAINTQTGGFITPTSGGWS